MIQQFSGARDHFIPPLEQHLTKCSEKAPPYSRCGKEHCLIIGLGCGI